MKIDPGVLSRLAFVPVLERDVGNVHPSWIEDAPVDPKSPAEVWQLRSVQADLPPKAPAMLPLDLAWLIGVGADQLAFALGEEAARIPSLAYAVVRIAEPPRRGELGPKRAALARCQDANLEDELAFVRVACRALAPHVATNRLAQLQLSRALPRPIGLVIERELLAYANVSLDQVPSWAALVAR